MDEKCFYSCDELQSIEFPESLKEIPIQCLSKCRNLSKITIPINETRIVIGNKIFNNQPHFQKLFNLQIEIQALEEQEIFFLGGREAYYYFKNIEILKE